MKIGIIVFIVLVILSLVMRSICQTMAFNSHLYQKKNTNYTNAATFIYKADREKKRCLLIHGISGSTDEMRPLALYLKKYGITSVCPRLPGHGTSVYNLEKTRMKDYSNFLKKNYSKEKFDFIIGLCAGANLAIDLASENKYNKLVLISPLFKYKAVFLGKTWGWTLPIIKIFWPYYRKKDYPEYKELIDYRILPLANIFDLYSYNRITRKKLSAIKVRTLVIFGGQDDLYHPTLPEYLSKTMHNAIVTIVPQGKHVLPMMKDNHGTFAAIKNFLLH